MLALGGYVSSASRGVVGPPVQLTGAGALERREYGKRALGGVEHDQSVLLAHDAGPASRLGDVVRGPGRAHGHCETSVLPDPEDHDALDRIVEFAERPEHPVPDPDEALVESGRRHRG